MYYIIKEILVKYFYLLHVKVFNDINRIDIKNISV